jgi:hypothetical protein
MTVECALQEDTFHDFRIVFFETAILASLPLMNRAAESNLTVSKDLPSHLPTVRFYVYRNTTPPNSHDACMCSTMIKAPKQDLPA